MKLPLSWFRDFVDIEKEPDKLATLLTLSGTKVDDFHKEGEDTLFEFEITPNRADCYSVYGIAREIAALTHTDLKELDTQLQYQPNPSLEPLKLVLKDKDLIKGYSLGVFENATVTDSPPKIADRLAKSGMRPVDSIVDVTNYVMLETGIPSHAFDYDKIKNHRMIVRASQNGEKVTTLDNVERNLPKGAIVIEDSEKLIDLAGLMGGENSAIDAHTTRIGLLVPIYNPINIRRTSIALNLRTEASGRFEKNLDPTAVKDAFYRIARLLFETSGARLSSEVVIHHPKPEPQVVEVTLGDIEDHLGIEVDGEDLVNYLTPLGFLVKHLAQEGSDHFSVTVPTWRTDVAREVDVIEEVARLYGYNSFPKTLPTGTLPTHEDSFDPDWEREVKETLVSLGLNETMGYTLLSEAILTKSGFNPNEVLRIINPNSEDFVFLRPSLLPTLLEQISLNLKSYPQVGLFEIGKVFSDESKDLPSQDRQLAIVTTADFAHQKGYLQVLADRFGLNFSYQPSTHPSLETSGDIYISKTKVGELGLVDRSLAARFDLRVPIHAATLNFEVLAKHISRETHYQPLPKYPTVKEDLAVLVDQSVTTEELVDLVRKVGKPLLVEVEPFDYFVSSKLGEGKKSIALSLTFGANKTLTGIEVAKVREKITKELKKTLRAEIR